MAWDNTTRTSQAAWKRLRQQAKHELPYMCQHCGATEHLELDHIVNVKSGGVDELGNLQWLCATCHMKKTQQEATKARNAWKRKPETHPGLK